MADPLLTPFAELCGALRGLQEQVQQLAHVHEAVDDFNAAFGAFQGAMALHASCLSYPKSAPVPPAPKQTKTSPSSGIPVPGSAHISPTGSGPEGKRDGSAKQGRSSKDGQRAVNGDSKQGKKRPAASMKRHGTVQPHGLKKRRKAQAPKNLAAWTWERRKFRVQGWKRRRERLTLWGFMAVDVREKIPRKYQSPAELKKLENIVLYLKNRHCAMYVGWSLAVRGWSRVAKHVLCRWQLDHRPGQAQRAACDSLQGDPADAHEARHRRAQAREIGTLLRLALGVGSACSAVGTHAPPSCLSV